MTWDAYTGEDDLMEAIQKPSNVAKLTDDQQRLLGALRAAVARLGQHELSYGAEWLGFFPYGAYHWLELGGTEISLELPRDWSQDDLEALVVSGALVKLAEWQDPDDEWSRKATYRLAELSA